MFKAIHGIARHYLSDGIDIHVDIHGYETREAGSMNVHLPIAHKELYSETTWAVGIAQLTLHEVCSGGKNPETGGRGIFAPTVDKSGELIAQYRPTVSFRFYPLLYLRNHLYFLKSDSLKNTKRIHLSRR